MSGIPKYSGEIKKGIVTIISNYPGLSLRELARELKISSSLTKYHLDNLIEEKKIVGIKDKKAIRFFLSEHKISNDDFKILKLLRNQIILEFVILFLNTYSGDFSNNKIGKLRNSDLYKKLRFNSKGTITYYLKKLLEEKILVKAENTANEYYLRDPETINRMLRLYKPYPSIIENFMTLWLSFYQKKL